MQKSKSNTSAWFNFVSSLIIFLSLVLASKAYSQISFAPYQTYPTGSWPEVVCIGDVNNDGLNDVVLGLSYYFDPGNDYKILVYLQDNMGNLMSPVMYPYPELGSGYGINTIAIGDVNDDSLNDVIIGYTDSVGVFYQNNSGTLDSIQTYYSGVYGNSSTGYRLALNVGDLNNDGLNDIAVAHSGQSVISILYQQSGGGFSTVLYPYGGGLQIEVVDINNDNLNDIVFMKYNGIGTLTQNTLGVLDNYQTDTNTISYNFNKSIAVGDLNNDGLNDVAEPLNYTDSTGYTNTKIALFFQDNISYQLQAPIYIQASNNDEVVRIADLNCDGRNEIIAANSAEIETFEQNSSNNYQSFTSFINPYATHYNPQGMSVGDINNDHRKDVVLANYNSGLVIFMNQSLLYGYCCTLPAIPSIPYGDTAICQNDDTSMYKPSITDTGNVSWSIFPVQAGSIIFSDNDSCQIAWSNSWQGIAGIYTSATNSCHSVYSDTLNVFVNRVQTINLGNDTTLCSNDSLILFAGNENNTIYTWQDNSIDTIYTVTTDGTYYVESSNVCGTASDTIYIQSVPLPSVNLGNDTLLCSGTTIQYDVTLPGNNNYLWQDNSTNPVYTVTTQGVYSVTVTDSNNCHNQESVSVNEISVPDIHLPNDTIYCDTINFVLNLGCSGCSYLWQDSSTDSVYSISNAGQYSVTVSNICGSTTDSLLVSEIPLPVIELPDDTSFCSGVILTMDVTQQGDYPYHYLWQDGSTGSVFTVTGQGEYTIIISDSDLCQVSHTIIAEELTAPIINFPGDTSICIGNSFTLNAYNAGCEYLWQDGSTSPQYLVQDSGVYIATVINICGSVSDTLKVGMIDCNFYLDVPSAFSPNGDGNNDVLYAIGKNVDNINFIIYDRWGEKVFESKSLTTGWDGTFKGKKLEANVFMYHLTATSAIDGSIYKKEGNISLIR
jgi:gliding motility-associated-like protein